MLNLGLAPKKIMNSDELQWRNIIVMQSLLIVDEGVILMVHYSERGC